MLRSIIMSRPRVPYLRVDYKLSIPAELAARIDLVLEDPLTRRPKYGARSKLGEALFRNWLASVTGEGAVSIPSVGELQEMV
mgnify:CR=1 FL=1